MALALDVPDEALLRLLVAVLLGAAVGVEREVNDQPAGLRTHIAVCLGLVDCSLDECASNLASDLKMATRRQL